MKETRYKVGQYVRIKTDLVDGKRYPMENNPDRKILFVDGMKKFMGKVMKVKYADSGYALENGQGYAWSDGMLEPVDGVSFTSLL